MASVVELRMCEHFFNWRRAFKRLQPPSLQSDDRPQGMAATLVSVQPEAALVELVRFRSDVNAETITRRLDDQLVRQLKQKQRGKPRPITRCDALLVVVLLVLVLVLLLLPQPPPLLLLLLLPPPPPLLLLAAASLSSSLSSFYRLLTRRRCERIACLCLNACGCCASAGRRHGRRVMSTGKCSCACCNRKAI
jgi:hypothetical protein